MNEIEWVLSVIELSFNNTKITMYGFLLEEGMTPSIEKIWKIFWNDQKNMNLEFMEGDK